MMLYRCANMMQKQGVVVFLLVTYYRVCHLPYEPGQLVEEKKLIFGCRSHFTMTDAVY